MKKWSTLLVLCLFLSLKIFGQDSLQVQESIEDSISTEKSAFKEHSVKKAALLSTAFPGLGQVYNKKYWKLPIVYGAIGVGVYFIVSQSKEMKVYNNALTGYYNNTLTDPNLIALGEAGLKANRDYYRRNLEISAIVTSALYVLNIIDAIVDAHLFTFDVSDDLTMTISPNILTTNNSQTVGLSLSLKFQ